MVKPMQDVVIPFFNFVTLKSDKHCCDTAEHQLMAKSAGIGKEIRPADVQHIPFGDSGPYSCHFLQHFCCDTTHLNSARHPCGWSRNGRAGGSLTRRVPQTDPHVEPITVREPCYAEETLTEPCSTNQGVLPPRDWNAVCEA